MNNNIIVDVEYLKELVKRFDNNKNLIKETNGFVNGLNLIVMKGGKKNNEI